ncbi:MAG: 3-isopropylmalate dehydratase [Candidatus Heimdallarchaeota archaeon]|nr:MAG: 3-isopropylmalate dehydratase [Candidatus Heimdallarchaeota archaeon]
MKFKGKIWIFPEKNINTDQIFPGKYTYDPLTPEQMAEYALEDYLPSFAKEVKKGDILITGQNFGSGSSREQAVTCLKAAGVAAIVGISFGRIFYRNAINNAFPLIQCPKATYYIFEKKDQLKDEKVQVDLVKGEVLVGEKTFSFPPLKGEALNIFEAGGLLEYTKEKLQ